MAGPCKIYLVESYAGELAVSLNSGKLFVTLLQKPINHEGHKGNTLHLLPFVSFVVKDFFAVDSFVNLFVSLILNSG
jgi:hypothetical protein